MRLKTLRWVSVNSLVKKAFSLIELMIVIVIVGVVYSLAVSGIRKVSEKEMLPSLSNLKVYLKSYLKEDAKSVRYLCLDDCSECSIYVDGIKTKTLKSFFDESIETYTYNFLQGTQELRDAVFFNREGKQESVCFSLTMDKNSISDQYIVRYKERVYDYTPYFTQTKVYDSLEELQDEKEKLAQEVMQWYLSTKG